MNYKETYNMAFNVPNYSNEHHIQYDHVIHTLKNIFNEDARFEIIDIGSGRGQLIHLINKHFKNASITSVDLTKYHNENVDYFIECDLSKNEDRIKLLNKRYDILVCTDVLEHLDKSFVDNVLDLFSKLSNKAILAIANHSDILNGVELHTIQENNTWWDTYLTKYYKIYNYDCKYDGRLYIYFVNSIY